MTATTTGASAEALAAQFLERQGLKLTEKNYRCRFGEIDLIMRDGNTVVFVEVRLRSHGAFGGAAASITAAKRHKLIACARHYLAAGRAGTTPACRFDVVLLNKLDSAAIEWLRAAFGE